MNHEQSLHQISFPTMSKAYPVLRDHILDYGQYVAPRGEPTREVLGQSFIIEDAVAGGVPINRGRKVGVKMMAIDGTGNFAGESYPDVAIGLAKVMDRFADDLPAISDRHEGEIEPDFGLRLEIIDRQPQLSTGERFFQGAYGPRIGDQLEKVEEQLRRDPDTRQAVVSLWSETDRNPAWKDRPCTTEFQLMIREGRLDIHVFMRANDLWTGTCYDVFQFGQIQAAMANILGVPHGRYYHHATSLHIYERDIEKFDAVQYTDVPNERESIGPGWASVGAGEYGSWKRLRDAYRVMLEAASAGEPFLPANAVEAWYWAVLSTGRAPE